MNVLDSVRDRLGNRDELAAYKQRDSDARDQDTFMQGAKAGEERTLAEISPRLEGLLQENAYMKDVFNRQSVPQEQIGLYNS